LTSRRRTIDLEPGSTKNDDARIVVTTREVYELLRACIRNKAPDDLVFTPGKMEAKLATSQGLAKRLHPGA